MTIQMSELCRKRLTHFLVCQGVPLEDAERLSQSKICMEDSTGGEMPEDEIRKLCDSMALMFYSGKYEIAKEMLEKIVPENEGYKEALISIIDHYKNLPHSFASVKAHKALGLEIPK